MPKFNFPAESCSGHPRAISFVYGIALGRFSWHWKALGRLPLSRMHAERVHTCTNCLYLTWNDRHEMPPCPRKNYGSFWLRRGASVATTGVFPPKLQDAVVFVIADRGQYVVMACLPLILGTAHGTRALCMGYACPSLTFPPKVVPVSRVP